MEAATMTGNLVPALSSTSAINATIAAGALGHRPGWLTQMRILLYLLRPEELYFPTLESTPNFMVQPVPLMVLLIVVEMLVKRCLGQKDNTRVDSYVSNIGSMGLQDSFSQFIFRGAELYAYSWIYDNFRVCTLPWDSFFTYVFAIFAVDYFAYWWHRGSHEISLFWAAHEFHHNSEDFNLSVSLRLSVTMRFYKWLFYLPTAVMGLPVSTMWAHAQLGFIFNGFSHISIIPPLGKVIPVFGDIIEFIFVTPTHHRVHHAMNEYAIDKNYGNMLILWDRLHGTFVDEKKGEKLSFGTLTPFTTSSIIQLQNMPFVNLWNKVKSMDTFGDKVRAVCYGPGWSPGRPRLGLHEELPDMRGRPKWQMRQPAWVKMYLFVNTAAVFFIYIDGVNRVQELSATFKLCCFVFIYFWYWSLGAVYDYRGYGVVFEAVRIAAFLFMQTISATPLIAAPGLAKLATTIAVVDLAVLPFLARNVYGRCKVRPTEQELYVKRLEKQKYLDPKNE